MTNALRNQLAKLNALAAAYESTGRIARIYPRKERVSVDGVSLTFAEAEAKMQRVVDAARAGGSNA